MRLLIGTVNGSGLLRLCAVALLLLAQLSPAQSIYNFNRDYDPYFRTFSAMYLGGYLPGDDFRWFLAQCIQESGPKLNPYAVSWAGAAGPCQLMPGTARDFGLDPAHRTLIKENIQVGAMTMRRCGKLFYPRETREQKLKLMQACYNAGGGHIIRAQVKCGGALLWEDIAPCLSQVTGRHAAETLNYVKIIPRWYELLLKQDELRNYDYPVSDTP